MTTTGHPPLIPLEPEYNFAYRYGNNGRGILLPPTVTNLPLRDNFDVITVADKLVLNRASWKDETGSVYDAFKYMVRYRSVPRDRLMTTGWLNGRLDLPVV